MPVLSATRMMCLKGASEFSPERFACPQKLPKIPKIFLAALELED